LNFFSRKGAKEQSCKDFLSAFAPWCLCVKYSCYCFLKLNLKYNKTNVSTSTTALAEITGPLLMANAYTNQTIVLVRTIKIIQILRSPTLFDCQDLYTCGKKVIEVKNDPK
jgi:hypothetical protein